MIYADGTKQCSKCYKALPLNMFYKDKRKKDGHVNTCKICLGVKNPNRQKKDTKDTYKIQQYNKYYKDNTKLCVSCNTYKDPSEFDTRISYDGLSKECTQCITTKIKHQRNHYAKIYRNNIGYAEKSYLSIYTSARRRNKDFNISRSGFINWYNTTSDKCYYCNIDSTTYSNVMATLSHQSGDLSSVASQVKYSPRLTIDRKDNTQGYNLDNICKSCWFCNVTKGVLLTEQDMSIISSGIYRQQIKCLSD